MLEIHVPLEESFFLYVSNAFTSVSSSRSLFKFHVGRLREPCRGVISGLPLMLQSEDQERKF